MSQQRFMSRKPFLSNECIEWRGYTCECCFSMYAAIDPILRMIDTNLKQLLSGVSITETFHLN
ncbi:hypothetical protein BLOT_004402 [Blomia tropicalis]|nr:hypothetical protein BLOT_004402 [Blomia tropicalis]